jgi:hypothetical protein
MVNKTHAVDKLTDDHVATIYEAYQADIYLSLEDFRREVARWRTHWVIIIAWAYYHIHHVYQKIWLS